MANAQKPWTRLTVTRERDGHTKTSLAAKVIMPTTGKPMSLGYLNDLETGRREPNPSITLLLARALNVPVSYIEKEDRIDGRPAA
jgi:transcriptional regulator with XRE-family HTH domain